MSKIVVKSSFPKMKGIKLHIPIDKSVTPVVQHARRPPIALLGRIEEKLDHLEAADIIEKVNQYSDWVSPLVIIVKDSGDLRICVDMRVANRAIKREHHLMPTIEDFLPRLKSAKYFSRLDIKDAFHQIELDELSRPITTFITHRGMYRYKRLMFGVSCAPEMFQKIIEQLLADCENCVNYIDDIIVFGADEEEHNRCLQKVLAVLQSHDVLLNDRKCLFKVTELEFLGHHVSSEGIRPAESKVEALQSFRPPQNVEELRSFLGLATYVGRFLPNLATISAPLRTLTRNGTPFVWNEEQDTAFKKLKNMIGDVKQLKFFDNKLHTRVIADASPVALGAVLVQFQNAFDDSNPFIICYASRSLSSTEQRYCQTEKEALALVWAVERFSMYLIGRVFELETDHKPLESLFKSSSRPCPRIERWVLRLQCFTFTVKYRKGSTNIADPLSRLTDLRPMETKNKEQEDKFLVLAILESTAIDIGEIEEASIQDAELTLIRDSLRCGTWNRLETKAYEPFRNELGLVGEIVVRNNKMVIPVSLRRRFMELAHEGHPGESAMKRRMRDRVWWPGMDKEIAKWVASCEGCRLVGLPQKPEPMQRRPLPSEAWVDVAIDFLGPLPSGEYLLVIIDYYSRYKEVEVMTKITGKETVNKLHTIFRRLGFPRTITLDNARQFISLDFSEYCKTNGIHLNFTTPYWPQQNGEVERQNRSLLKRLQISSALKRDWQKDLNEYLIMYYSTPHSVTGKTPTELLLGRTIRTKIPFLKEVETNPITEEFQDRDWSGKYHSGHHENEKRNAKESNLKEGDKVVMQNLNPGNKLSTTFDPTECTIVSKSGTRVTVQNEMTGKTYQRNSAHLKKIIEPEEQRRVSMNSSTSQDIQRSDAVAETSSSRDHLVTSQELDQQLQSNLATYERPKRSSRRPTKYDDYVVNEDSSDP